MAVPAGAQKFPNGLAVDSVDPVTDSIVISQMRDKLDSIRIAERRPTVALVLSGGGAKGAAHIGVLKVLKELDIPIDMICGTSIGGLVGGLYSMGYSPEYLETLMRNQDWSVTLTDKISQKYVPYSTKQYQGMFLVSIPFHYKNADFETRIIEQEKYSGSDGHLHMGADDGDMSTQMGINSFSSSLPSGYVYGFNVNNLISSLTVGYQDSLAFKDLPIPFFAVSSDMVSCKAKNWGSGSVKSAMRSTMSIPGMFDPVRSQGMVLVDGGTRNNFPVDIAKSMGADFVIGVEISDAAPVYSQVNNLGNILSQFIKMLGQDAFEKNIPKVDVFIKPDLQGYNMLSFSTEAISTMIDRGYRAAKEKQDELKAIKHYTRNSSQKLFNKPATDISKTSVQLGSVIFNGMFDRESRMLQHRIDIPAGSRVNRADIEEAMSKIQATGAFETVTYTLLGSEEPYRLVFNCAKAPVHQTGIGLRADSEELVSLLFNVGLNTHKLMGSKLDFTAKVGTNRFADIRYSLDLPYLPTINAEASISHSMGQMIFARDSKHYNPSYTAHKEMVYFSNLRWTAIDMQAGIMNHAYIMPESLFTDMLESAYPGQFLSGDYVGAFAKGGAYTLDRKYYPTKGFDFHFNYVFDFMKLDEYNYRPVQTIAADFKGVIPLGHHVAIVPDIHLRSIVDHSGNSHGTWSLPHTNYVGGAVEGRFIENQVPFVGFNGFYTAADHLAVANVDLRINAAKNFYVSLLGGYMRQSGNFLSLFKSLQPSFLGAGLELGYNSIIGPIRANVHWSDMNNAFEGYISVGFDF